jgi:TRAP transporter TAXI family solute receptor
LYQEAFHLVARKGAGITGVADLKGKRVSLGEQGSGTLVDALAILDAHGLKQRDVKASFLKPGASADALVAGEIDAFFFVAGAPVTTISTLIEGGHATLVPIAGAAAEKLASTFPFLVLGEIPAGAYPGVDAVPTITVGAVLACDATLPDDLVYGITRALWHPNTLALIARGHPGGVQLDAATATQGLGIPLHAGAATYYFDAGLME